MHFFLTSLLSILIAQANPTVVWKAAVNHIQDNNYQLVLTGQVADGWYVHPMADEYVGTTLEVSQTEGVAATGDPVEEFTPSDYKGESVVTGTYLLRQDLEITGSGTANVGGTVTWSACSGDECNMPEEYEFSVPVEIAGQAGNDGAVAGNDGVAAGNDGVAAGNDGAAKSGTKGLWALILEAILWGFLMLLTPCVFPMVPMTVSFFLKRSGTAAKGRFNALMYGLFIVLLYTVPICIIIGLTWALGGKTVTADIFNWLSTHWLPNILFFIIFMVFAASFFGAFEITLPSKWTNKADSGSDKKGLAGVFFLALALVLVSFSCTGPIVGTVLIKSTQGEFWTPMVTMLAFSIAFALPFALLAFFPSVLKKLPKSGGWLNSVKVVLGFIEIALGLKFLSVADQTYHWHLLDREVYLAIWIVCFTLLGIYLMGKIRFKNDTPLEYISVGRLVLIIIDFAFVVYMIPGMWGAPLKALSGYLPPIQTQDFVLGSPVQPGMTYGVQPGMTYGNSGSPVQPGMTYGVQPGMTYGDNSAIPDLIGDLVPLPHGLTGYSNLDDAIAAAAAEGKKVFVDISGHGCVNCREMETRVWSNPEVLKRLRDDFVIATLYVDDKTPLPKDKWVVNSSGKTLKDVGRVNSDLVLNRFGVNSQPNYFILDGEGNTIAGPRGYNLDAAEFVKFLEQ
ncbi:MAG: thioredoxin family protein [Bacteroidales bacterium]|nr:thioredoxin family protein [Bacteroidales bacterium]